MTSVNIISLDGSLEFYGLKKPDTSCSSCSGKKYNIVEQAGVLEVLKLKLKFFTKFDKHVPRKFAKDVEWIT